MPRWFGTDGIRGESFTFPVTEQVFRAIGFHWGRDLVDRYGVRDVIVARDTRASSHALAHAFMEGLVRANCRVHDLGIFPTPATIILAHRWGTCAGIITASHNLYPDNGLKLVQPDGRKIPETVEDMLEQHLQDVIDPPDDFSVVHARDAAYTAYTQWLVQTFAELRDLARRLPRLYLDMAHGAAFRVYPAVLMQLGFHVTTMYAEPNGTNINVRCGAVHPEVLHQHIRSTGDQHCLGFAYDGDGDRVIGVHPEFGLLDGHIVLAVLARWLQQTGSLGRSPAVVSTVMANQALETLLSEWGIRLIRTAVGDKYVADALDVHGLYLGAEPSGHVILRHLAPTGDGLLTTLALLQTMHEQPEILETVCTSYRPFPQILHNVRVREKIPLDQLPELQQAVATWETRLNGRGRVFLRYSGTEPVLRILVECVSSDLAETCAQDLARIAHRILAPQ